MGSFAFWSPVLRAWLAALPYFITGMLGLYIQMERMRKSSNKTVETRFDALQAHIDQKFAERHSSDDAG